MKTEEWFDNNFPDGKKIMLKIGLSVQNLVDKIDKDFISKQKIQDALDKTSNWNCKEVLTKLLEDK